MKIISFSFHIGDFLGGTMHMSAEEIGIYTLLLIAHYQYGDSGLPLDENQLARIARVGVKKWRKISPNVISKFEKTESGFVSQRVVAELRRMNEKSSAGKANILKRWNSSHTAVSDSYNGGNTILNPITYNHLEEEKEKEKIDKKEKENFQSTAPPDGVAQATTESKNLKSISKAQNRGSRLPDDWLIPDPWLAEAQRLRPDVAPEKIKAEADIFKDYWIAQSGQKGVKNDWNATWRNWIRRADFRTKHGFNELAGSAKSHGDRYADTIRSGTIAALGLVTDH
ncbi:Protein of unknown function DUF1376 [uncultured Caudovirales phage]|uniref:DUF1376 domain-containing protein n=1 Tax=uncultured Caudovirales phage TaxID=2100421 RepID=A0A6J5M4A2_9CAUD|nr:Protein of unknown function DUF1376 [uncultured Caudovirales phage]